jgi:glucose-6-phosphate isomerase
MPMGLSDLPPLKYDLSSVLRMPGGVGAEQIAALAPVLERRRDEVFQEDLPAFAQDRVPADKAPLDTAFVDLPKRLLAEYEMHRGASELGQILATAARLRDSVDRVVVLGIGGSYMGARALMDACCHPFHNELERGRRGGVPRMYFEGNNVDNDAMRGLLDLLPQQAAGTDPHERWALIVISKSGGTLETAVAFRQFLDALAAANGHDASALAELVVPITGREGRLFQVAQRLGCQSIFHVPDGVGGRFSVFSAVGLLPAAVLGLDVVRLLRGAAAMTEHFRTAAAAENLVLNYTAVSHLMETLQQATIRVLQVWSKSLESVGLWYDQLLAESLGKRDDVGATPLTVVNTRDLHSRAQQHQEGRRDKIYTNLVLSNWKTDPLRIQPSPYIPEDEDKLDALTGKSVIDLMNAAIRGTNQAYNDDHRPTADLVLPASDEASLGQLLQMLMLATVVEGRLLGVNPYGQPGVEAYKINMKRELGL